MEGWGLNRTREMLSISWKHINMGDVIRRGRLGQGRDKTFGHMIRKSGAEVGQYQVRFVIRQWRGDQEIKA
jgi:hypothetical protein